MLSSKKKVIFRINYNPELYPLGIMEMSRRQVVLMDKFESKTFKGKDEEIVWLSLMDNYGNRLLISSNHFSQEFLSKNLISSHNGLVYDFYNFSMEIKDRKII